MDHNALLLVLKPHQNVSDIYLLPLVLRLLELVAQVPLLYANLVNTIPLLKPARPLKPLLRVTLLPAMLMLTVPLILDLPEVAFVVVTNQAPVSPTIWEKDLAALLLETSPIKLIP